MSKAIGVRIIEDDVERVEWHAPPAGGTDYHTLCGIDSDDPEIGHCGTVEPKRGQKIECGQCRLIWEDVIALRLRKSDFKEKA